MPSSPAPYFKPDIRQDGVPIICNRETPSHRDAQANPQWYDILATMGSYQELHFHLMGLGMSFHYPPGTVIALCGKLLTHACESTSSLHMEITHLPAGMGHYRRRWSTRFVTGFCVHRPNPYVHRHRTFTMLVDHRVCPRPWCARSNHVCPPAWDIDDTGGAMGTSGHGLRGFMSGTLEFP